MSTITFECTLADIGDPPWGFDRIGLNPSSIDPDPPMILLDGEFYDVQAIRDYGALSGIEVELISLAGLPVSNPTWNDAPFIRLNHSGGQLVLDTRDIGVGGDLTESASSKSTGFLYYWFATSGGIWTVADDALAYDCEIEDEGIDPPPAPPDPVTSNPGGGVIIGNG